VRGSEGGGSKKDDSLWEVTESILLSVCKIG